MVEQHMDKRKEHDDAESRKPVSGREDPNPNQYNRSFKSKTSQIHNGASIDFYLVGNDLPIGEGPSAKSAAASLKQKKSVRWSKDLVMESAAPTRDHGNGFTNTYPEYPIASSSSFDFRGRMGSMKDVLGRWGKKVEEATRKAEDLAGSTWQHLKTSPSLADAALGRIAHGTKVLAEGGYENIFRQTFETLPDEQLQYSYACYLSTSAGPIMGVLYVSTAKLAFSSDNPILRPVDDNSDCSYYKVVIPMHQLKAVKPSTSRTNSSEKYIQVVTMDGGEFWYMGFLNYCGAVQCLQQALQARQIESVFF